MYINNIYVNVWQKPLKYCKVISLQLIKINGGKNTVFVLQKTLQVVEWVLQSLLFWDFRESMEAHSPRMSLYNDKADDL